MMAPNRRKIHGYLKMENNMNISESPRSSLYPSLRVRPLGVSQSAHTPEVGCKTEEIFVAAVSDDERRCNLTLIRVM